MTSVDIPDLRQSERTIISNYKSLLHDQDEAYSPVIIICSRTPFKETDKVMTSIEEYRNNTFDIFPDVLTDFRIRAWDKSYVS